MCESYPLVLRGSILLLSDCAREVSCQRNGSECVPLTKSALFSSCLLVLSAWLTLGFGAGSGMTAKKASARLATSASEGR